MNYKAKKILFHNEWAYPDNGDLHNGDIRNGDQDASVVYNELTILIFTISIMTIKMPSSFYNKLAILILATSKLVIKMPSFYNKLAILIFTMATKISRCLHHFIMNWRS